MSASRPEPIVLTGVGLISPAASSLDRFREVRAAAPEAGERAGTATLALDGFDPARHLGPRGFKYFTPATQYVLAAARMALEDARLDDAYEGADRGAVLGTNFAVWSVLADMDATILSAGADQLRPMEAANFSVNIPASQLSIRYGFNAFNITITTARIAGLEALALAAVALRQGRARMALAGAVEGRAPDTLQRYFSAPLAEGAACLVVLEPLSAARARGARVYAELGPSLVRFWPGVLQGVATADAADATEVMGVMGPRRERLHLFEAAHGCRINQALAAQVAARAVREGRGVERHVLSARFGECSTVSPMLQLLDLCLSGVPSGLVVAASPQGHVALSRFQAAA